MPAGEGEAAAGLEVQSKKSPAGKNGKWSAEEDFQQGAHDAEPATKSTGSRFGTWFKRKGSSETAANEDEDRDRVEEIHELEASARHTSKMSPRTGMTTEGTARSVQDAVRKATETSIFVKVGRILRAAMMGDKSMIPKNGSMTHIKENTAEAQNYNLRKLQERVYVMQYYVMVLAMLGLMSGVAVNEYCWLGYIPTVEEQTGFCSDSAIVSEVTCTSVGFAWNPGLRSPLDAEDGGRCFDSGGNGLKGISTALTVILLGAIFHMYECSAIELCMRNHLEYRRPFENTPFWDMGLLPECIIECAVCIIHPAPGLEYFVTVEARGRVSVYNCESVLVTIMFLRLYTVWRHFREWLFARYTSKNFVSRMNDVPMDSKLAMKAILDDKPYQTIALFFFIAVFVLAYLVRIAESPVNLQHVYFWNQLWLIVVTVTSTGYGDLYPLSHLGRFVCFLAMMVGIVLTAILIGVTSSKLALNANEARLMRFLQSENWERQIKVHAVRCIQSWWRRSLQHPRTLASLRAFRLSKRRFRKFLEATPHFGTFVENYKEEQVKVSETLDKIEHSFGIQGPRGSSAGSGVPTKNVSAAVAAMTGTEAAGPIPGKVFDEVMQELAQLRKTNEQLRGLVEKSVQGGGQLPGLHGASSPARRSSEAAGAAAAAAASLVQGGGAAKGKGSEEAATVASQAVEERVRRLEAQVTNFDKGMARCFAQVVRLVQGLY